MIGWLRDRLRRWLLDPPPPPPSIEARIDGRIVRVAIEGTSGACLVVRVGRGVRLITEAQAIDRQEYWRAWSARSADNITWEDGSLFEPPE